MERLAEHPRVIAAPGAPLRESWRRMFEDAGVAVPPVPIESDSVMAIRQLLIESDLLTMLSPVPAGSFRINPPSSLGR